MKKENIKLIHKNNELKKKQKVLQDLIIELEYKNSAKNKVIDSPTNKIILNKQYRNNNQLNKNLSITQLKYEDYSNIRINGQSDLNHKSIENPNNNIIIRKLHVEIDFLNKRNKLLLIDNNTIVSQ